MNFNDFLVLYVQQVAVSTRGVATETADIERLCVCVCGAARLIGQPPTKRGNAIPRSRMPANPFEFRDFACSSHGK